MIIMASSAEWGYGANFIKQKQRNLHKMAAPHLRLCMKKSSCPQNF